MKAFLLQRPLYEGKRCCREECGVKQAAAVSTRLERTAGVQWKCRLVSVHQQQPFHFKCTTVYECFLAFFLVRGVSGHGWAPPRRHNADVGAAYIAEKSAHAAWAEKLDEHRRSSFFTARVCLLSSPGNAHVVSAKCPCNRKGPTVAPRLGNVK